MCTSTSAEVDDAATLCHGMAAMRQPRMRRPSRIR
jgi:hypothetical protein